MGNEEAIKKFDGVGFLAALEREKVVIAEARDRLRELIEDAQGIEEMTSEALDSLTCAADELSRYV